jgi:hypothetical protein
MNAIKPLRLLFVAALLVTAVASVAQNRALMTAEEQYAELSALPRVEQSAALMTVPAVRQQELWAIHLERFLAAHPDLTADQRAVVFQALGLLRASVLERLRSADPAVALQARADLDALDHRAKAVLGRELAQEAIERLASQPAEPKHFTAAPLDLCYCSTTYQDVCGGGFVCGSDLRCTPDLMCGPFGWDACDGTCQPPG